MARKSAILAHPKLPEINAAILAGEPLVRIAERFDLPSYPVLKRWSVRLRSRGMPGGPVAVTSASEIFRLGVGHPPEAHQRAILEETRDTIVKKTRQTGCSTAAAIAAIDVAKRKPGSTSAILSVSQNQSTIVTRRARHALWALGEDLKSDTNSRLELANGSQIISLPGSARAARGWSLDLLVLDEAAYLPEDSIEAALPTTTATQGRTIWMSTPAGPHGMFYEMWNAAEHDPDTARVDVHWRDVPFVNRKKVEQARARMDPEAFAREYEGEFSLGMGLRPVTSQRLEDLTMNLPCVACGHPSRQHADGPCAVEGCLCGNLGVESPWA